MSLQGLKDKWKSCKRHNVVGWDGREPTTWTRHLKLVSDLADALDTLADARRARREAENACEITASYIEVEREAEAEVVRIRAELKVLR